MKLWAFRTGGEAISRKRWSLVPVALAAFTCLLPTVAQGAEHSGFPSGLNRQASSEHFVIHYTTSGSSSRKISTTNAQKVLAMAESAYAIEIGRWGYPAPVADSDGKIDLYIYKCSGLGTTHADNKSAKTTSGWICLRPKVKNPTVAHELFHLVQYAISRKNPRWLREATAETVEKLVGSELDGAAFQLDSPAFASFPEASLNCATKSCFSRSAPYRQWSFFNYLVERYGNGILREIFQRADNTKDALPALEGALATHGISLSQAYTSYIRSVAVANFGFGPLKGVQPKIADSETVTTASLTFQPYRAAIDHLAAQFIRFSSSASVSQNGCGSKELRIMVTPARKGSPIRSGLGSQGRELQPASKSGRSTIYSLAWDPCVERTATLALINQSKDLDKQGVRVTATFGDAVPTLSLNGPSVINVASGNPRVQLSLVSSLSGSVEVSLGHGKLSRRFMLQQGNNRLNIFVPRELRRGRLELALTPRSLTDYPGSATRATLNYQ